MMIQVKNLCKKFKKQTLYDNLSISFEEQKVTSILGPSGCGKTTLLRILAGLEPYQKGEILGIAHKKIAYVFQEDRLVPWMSVEDNIKLVLKSYTDSKEAERRTDEVLKMLKLSEYKNRMPEELSGGMQRRAASGRALAYDGDILLMDEPFKELDSELKEDILSAFNEMQQKAPKTVICITHDEREAQKISDSIYDWKSLIAKQSEKTS